MSNQGFNQWAAQQPAPAGFNPGAAPAGPPMGPPVGAPAAQGWGQAPAGPPPGYQGTSQVPGPHGFGAPGGNGGHPGALPAQPPGNAFGAGAFAGAAPVSEQKDCQDGDYIFEIIKTEQFKTREGQPMLRIVSKVAHVIAGTQPKDSEVTDSIFYGQPGSDAFRYGMADLLGLAQHALECNSDYELKSKLAAAQPSAPDAWAALADAMQDANQVANPFFGPNPLKGMYYRAQVSHVPSKKKAGKFNTNFNRMRAK